MYKTYVCLPYNFEKNLFLEYHEKKIIYIDTKKFYGKVTFQFLQIEQS